MILTKQYINDHVRQYTVHDGLFKGCLRESVLLDIEPYVEKGVQGEILAVLDSAGQEQELAPSASLNELLDGGLRLALAYFVFARTIRSSMTATRFGTTTKMSDYSQPTEYKEIVQMSNYYRECAEHIMEEMRADGLCGCRDKAKTTCGQYLKADVVGD